MQNDGLILVTGGTGNLGRRVVSRLREAGRRLRVLSRQPHAPAEGVEYVVGDLFKNEGVDTAVAGAWVIVHCAGVGKINADREQARNLVQAAERAGVRHLVNVSVVGADRIPLVSGVDRAMFAYFASQLAGEQEIARSRVPWTNLRATQFHDGFILLMVQAMVRLPVIPVPAGFRFQPVDAGEVADRVVELTLGAPAGQVADFGGPKIYPASDLLRSYLDAVGKRRLLLSMRLPGRAAQAIRDGANLVTDRALGRRTWEQFLTEWSRRSARGHRALT